MTAADILSIGLENLASYIATENNFLTAVREYRCTDLGGYFCSNVYTSFEAGKLSHLECEKSLEEVSRFAWRCHSCLENNKECRYRLVNEKCTHCQLTGEDCVSLLPFHNLWDMDSIQKKAVNSIEGLDLTSSEQEFMRADKMTFGFGGLHICKALINPARNCILSYKGENYGINILRCHKLHPSLSGCKNAIFLGKDHQCDKLAQGTRNQVVQDGLVELKTYHVVRVPEPLIGYHENCKSQEPFRHPVSLACNKNGEIFVLDAASATCVYAIDRSSVSLVKAVGSFDMRRYIQLQQYTHFQR